MKFLKLTVYGCRVLKQIVDDCSTVNLLLSSKHQEHLPEDRAPQTKELLRHLWVACADDNLERHVSWKVLGTVGLPPIFIVGTENFSLVFQHLNDKAARKQALACTCLSFDR